MTIAVSWTVFTVTRQKHSVRWNARKGCDDLSEGNLTQKELAKVFRKTRKLYFAEVTALRPEAALCGAQTEFVTSSYEPVIPKGLDDPLAWHEEQERTSDSSLEHFLDVCYDRVGLKREVYA